MMIAVAFGSLSDHPLAKAIARDGRQFLDATPTPTAHDLQSLTGRDVQARIDGEVVRIGKAEMFGRDGTADLSTDLPAAIERLREQGRPTMVVRKADRALGATGPLAPQRDTAHAALAHPQPLGITR